MTATTAAALTEPLDWPGDGVSRVPFRLYADPEIYRLEQERIFRGPVWNFLCLEIDVLAPGDFKTSTVGEVPVVVTRDMEGRVHALVNRCAHRGALVCMQERGNKPLLSCLYHAWTYELDGRLKSVAFRNGLRGRGGMPEDFDPARHRLQSLRVEVFCGLVFGTFAEETPSVETYLGETVSRFMCRNLGRPLTLLGFHSQILHNNWKLYAENVRDSYHATLLHTFYTTFNVNRLDMDGGILLSDRGWHHVSYAKRATLRQAEEYSAAKVHAAQYGSQLAGPDLLTSWDEFEDGITHSIMSVFPTLAVQFTLNSLAVRFFQPRGVDETELFWMYVGYESDTEAQRCMRVRQGNLTGAAGLVSLEDGCINEFVQRGTRGSGPRVGFFEMGGRDVRSSEASRATEASVRGFWQGYRDIMGFE